MSHPLQYNTTAGIGVGALRRNLRENGDENALTGCALSYCRGYSGCQQQTTPGDRETKLPMSTDNALFHNHLVPFMPVHEQQQDAGDEEKDAIHDAECKARLQHCARLVDIDREGRVGGQPKVSKRSQANVHRGGCEVGATGIGNVAQLDHTGDESADEAEVDERNEGGRFAS